MTRDPSAGLPTMLSRALLRRCPRCGAPAFDSFFRLGKHCAGCGHRFEREEGYWVGALIINTSVTFAVFLGMFVGGMVLTWPDVPWGTILVLTLSTMALLPILFYPLSMTIWMALELTWHPLEEKEADAARLRVGG